MIQPPHHFEQHPKKASPASPFARESLAEVFNGLADFSPNLAYFFFYLTFEPLLTTLFFQVTVYRLTYQVVP